LLIQSQNYTTTSLQFPAERTAFGAGWAGDKWMGGESVKDLINRETVMICAHRGFTRNAPENSLQAVLDAIEAGFEVVEIDVRHTKDGGLVLMHDDTVDRTSNGRGKVEELSSAEFRYMRLLWRGKPFASIPLFSTVLEAAERRIIVYVDMKTVRVDLIAEVIKKHDAYDWTILLGGKKEIIEIQKIDPRFRLHTVVNSRDELDSLLKAVAPVMIEVSKIPDPDFIDYAHQRGLPVELDTLVKADFFAVKLKLPFLWKKIANSGVDFIMSDYPDRLRDYIRSNRK
jgi:glycerophosphoryl diester phosphodiesterase